MFYNCAEFEKKSEGVNGKYDLIRQGLTHIQFMCN